MNEKLFRRLLDQSDPDGHLRGEQALKRFAQAVAEECAKHFDGSDTFIYRSEVAAAIRDKFCQPPA